MWILKLSGFPFPHLFLSPLVIVSALNQPTQSDRLDFVLCILFSHFFSWRAAPPRSALLSAAAQRPGFYFSSNLDLCRVFGMSVHVAVVHCRYGMNIRLKCSSQEVQPRNTKQSISSNGKKIRERPVYRRGTREKLMGVERPSNQTPLNNYANPHAQVIVSSVITSLVLSNENTAKDKGSLAGSSFDILKKTLFLFFWVLMRNGRNGISFCTF